MESINVHDYERLAREYLSPGAWAYYSSGADGEVTLREERAAFERVRLLPRVLRGVAHVDLRTTVLGAPVRMAILVAPTGLHALAHTEGERATARGAGEAGTLMALHGSHTEPGRSHRCRDGTFVVPALRLRGRPEPRGAIG